MPPSPAPDTCWFYLIRHGATQNNLTRPPRLQGRADHPLSDVGRQQAADTARFLSNVPFEAVYSSPLLRARQTAELMAQARGLSVECVGDLIEVDVGDWEGRSWDEIQRTDPEAYRLFTSDAATHPYHHGENLSDVQARVVPAMERLMRENLGRTVLAVTHNVVNRVYLAWLLGISLARYRGVPQDNCGINVLEYRDGKVRLVTVNGVFQYE